MGVKGAHHGVNEPHTGSDIYRCKERVTPKKGEVKGHKEMKLMESAD